MNAPPTRSYTRLAVAIIVAGVVIGAGIFASSYLGTGDDRDSDECRDDDHVYDLVGLHFYHWRSNGEQLQSRRACVQAGHPVPEPRILRSLVCNFVKRTIGNSGEREFLTMLFCFA